MPHLSVCLYLLEVDSIICFKMVVLFPESWTSTGYFSKSTGSSVTRRRLSRKITDHFRGIYRVYPNLIKENRRMSTRNRFDLQTLASQLVMPKNLPNHWSPALGQLGKHFLWTQLKIVVHTTWLQKKSCLRILVGCIVHKIDINECNSTSRPLI